MLKATTSSTSDTVLDNPAGATSAFTDGLAVPLTTNSTTLPQAVLTTLATFDGTNGEYPNASLIAGANGTLFGTTTRTVNDSATGTVFELASGTTTLTALATIATSSAALVSDAAGDLFGTTAGGGFHDTVFEITAGSSTATTLATFNGGNGAAPTAGLLIDAAGNLFGTTYSGGNANQGTVFELAAGASSITTLGMFGGANGAYPSAGLIEDAKGDLFGTTTGDGIHNQGTVFEIAAGSGTIITLAAFAGANGASPLGGVITDAAGDLFGTTNSGGSANEGTVFELAAGTTSITTLASFTGGNAGAYPTAGLIADASNNLFGTTTGDGSNKGTVFELANDASTITTLVTFNGTNGAIPKASLIADAAGNLYGTTKFGADASGIDRGTVFELSNTGFQAFAVTSGPSSVATVNESPVHPFGGASVTDQNTSATDLLTITVTGAGGVLSGGQLTSGASGVYTLSGTAQTVSDGLASLVFTPTGGQPGALLTTTFAVTGQNTAGAILNAASLFAVTDRDPVAPVINGGTATLATISEAAVHPFAGVTITDGNTSAVDTVTITTTGAGGVLAGGSLSTGSGGIDTLSGTAASVTNALDALTFVPSAGQPGTSTTTRFVLTDSSTVGTTATAPAAISVTDSDPVVTPTISGGHTAVTTRAEKPVTPFAGVTVGDANAGGTDTLTITIAGAGGTLSGAGLTAGSGGAYTLTGTGSAITSALDALVFVPTGGQANTSGATTFSLTDQSTAFATPATGSPITVTNTDPAVAPVFAGGTASITTMSEAAVTPFAGLTLTDANAGGTDTLTITVSGTGGTLSGAGLVAGPGGTYTLASPAATVTGALDALSFVPTAGRANTSGVTTLRITDQNNAYATPVSAAAVTITNQDPAIAPTITGGGTVTTLNDAPVHPFAGVTVTDVNAAAIDTVTITATGAGGSLSGAGLATAGGGVYTLTSLHMAVTSALDALTFVPTTGLPGTSGTTSFSLSVASTAASTPATATVSVINTDTVSPPTVITAASPAATNAGPATLGTATAIRPTDALSVTLTSDTAFTSGSAITLAGGTLVYTPGVITASIAGADTLTYTVSDTTDGTSLTEVQTVTLGNGPAPTLTQVNAPLTVGALPVTLGATSGFGGDPVMAAITSDTTFTTGSTITVSGGAVVYTPGAVTAANAGADTVGYAVTDTVTGAVTSATQQVTLDAASGKLTSARYGAKVTATIAGTALVAGAAGQKLVGAGAGGDYFFAAADTNVLAYGNGNVITAASGAHTITAGGSNNTVILQGGSNSVRATGSGNTVIAGNGDDKVTGFTGASTITLGDGTDTVSITGAGNTVTLGNGNNAVHAGYDGNETVTVGNGINAIVVNGSGDTITAGNGANAITSEGANATITVGSGTNSIRAYGTGSTITVTGDGMDTINAIAGGAMIRAGTGVNTLTFSGSGTTVYAQGTTAITDRGTNNTIVLNSAGHGVTTFGSNHALSNGDVFDLRTALAATAWDGHAADLASYLKVSASGGVLVIGIAATAGGATTEIASIMGGYRTSYTTFLTHTMT